MNLESSPYMDAFRLAGYHFDIHYVNGTTSNTRQASLFILVGKRLVGKKKIEMLPFLTTNGLTKLTNSSHVLFLVSNVGERPQGL